jgi:transposase
MELLIMSTTELDRLAALQRYVAGGLTQAEVGRQLRLSERQVRRLLRRLEREGQAGIASRSRGRPSNNQLDPGVLDQALALIAQRYADFGPTFANEKLREIHGLLLGTESLRKAMIRAGLWQPRKRRPVRLHPPRPRRPSQGELVQVDGSLHHWFEERAPRCVLLDAVDDATSAILAGHFAQSESAEAYFELFSQLIQCHGRPRALYTDRHATFLPTRTSAHEDRVSQVGRALDELEIELICATSPQAKGRVERAHQTLQRRLVREMRLRNISTIDEANAYLPEFINDYNSRFAVAAACSVPAFRPIGGLLLPRILTNRFTRVVRKDLTFQIERQVYQLTDVVLPARLRGTTIDIRYDNQTMIVERCGQVLNYRLLDLRPDQGAVVAGKDLDDHLNRRAAQAPRKPAPNHPWRRTFLAKAPT